MYLFWQVGTIVAGRYKDHRQVAAGCRQLGEGLQGGGYHEATGPPTHYQAVPGKFENFH